MEINMIRRQFLYVSLVRVRRWGPGPTGEEARGGNELRLRNGYNLGARNIRLQQDIGKGIADMLVDKLVNDGSTR